jgi:hypothetical protein
LERFGAWLSVAENSGQQNSTVKSNSRSAGTRVAINPDMHQRKERV